MLLSRIPLLHWIKIPSIVFDQGSSAVWGEDRLAAEGLFHEENFLFLDNFSNKSPDFKPYDSDLDFLPAFHDPLFGLNTLKDYNFEMFTPDRARKCSISDIIDVLNDDKIFLQSSNTKDDGYDSGNPESASSPSGVSSNDSVSSDDLSFDEKATALDFNQFSRDGHHGITDATQYVAMKDVSQTSICSNKPHGFEVSATLQEEDIQASSLQTTALNSASALLSSENDAVIIIMDRSKHVQYVSTSREKLESFLKQENPQLNEVKATTIQQEELQIAEKSENQCYSNSALSEIQDNINEGKKGSMKRGRKRIYECSNEDQREDSKRVRNNEACRKFRKVKISKLKTLFEAESKLLQQNLNLKEEIAALQRQLTYIREKIGLEEDNNNN